MRGENESEGECVEENEVAGVTLKAAEDEKVGKRVARALDDVLPLEDRVEVGVATKVDVEVDVFTLDDVNVPIIEEDDVAETLGETVGRFEPMLVGDAVEERVSVAVRIKVSVPKVVRDEEGDLLIVVLEDSDVIPELVRVATLLALSEATDEPVRDPDELPESLYCDDCDEVSRILLEAVRSAACDAVSRILLEAVRSAACDAVSRILLDAVRSAACDEVSRILLEAVRSAVCDEVSRILLEAVRSAVCDEDVQKLLVACAVLVVYALSVDSGEDNLDTRDDPLALGEQVTEGEEEDEPDSDELMNALAEPDSDGLVNAELDSDGLVNAEPDSDGLVNALAETLSESLPRAENE